MTQKNQHQNQAQRQHINYTLHYGSMLVDVKEV
jgi:hypothetical protein